MKLSERLRFENLHELADEAVHLEEERDARIGELEKENDAFKRGVLHLFDVIYALLTEE